MVAVDVGARRVEILELLGTAGATSRTRVICAQEALDRLTAAPLGTPDALQVFGIAGRSLSQRIHHLVFLDTGARRV